MNNFAFKNKSDISLNARKVSIINSHIKERKAEMVHKFIIYSNGKSKRINGQKERVPFPHRCIYAEIKTAETPLLPLLQKELLNVHGNRYKIIKYKSQVLRLFPHIEIIRCTSSDQLVRQIRTFDEAEST
jgi:hypothetical protein